MRMNRVAEEMLGYGKASAGDRDIEQCIVYGGPPTLLIEDNGIGFDPGTIERHRALGLFGMHERIVAIGGHLTVESSPGAGTTVLVEVELENREAS